MSTAALDRTKTSPAGGDLAATSTLVRFVLRRDRVRLAVWVLSVGLLTVYTVIALQQVYPSAADRQARAALMSNPAAVMLGGPGFGQDDYTIGAMVANELGLSVIVIAAIMSVLLVVRHTRAEEESGRSELVRAAVVGRRAQLSAALLVMVAANGAIAVVIGGGLAATGVGVLGSVAFAIGVALTGVVFGGVAAVTAQLMEHARSATGSALAVLAAAAVVRGVGDVIEAQGSWLSWLSPIAWAQQTRVFVDLRWWPLLLSVVMAAALTWFAYRLSERRDVGAGLVPARPGPATAGTTLSGPLGLAIRLQRGSLIGWGIGLVLTGVTFGSLSNSVVDAVRENPALADFIAVGGDADLVAAFFSVLMMYLALGAVAFAVTAVLRLRGEESAGRIEPMLATALDRRRLIGASAVVAFGGAAVLLALSGAAMGAVSAIVTGESSFLPRLTGAALATLPGVAVLVAIALLLVGVLPRRAAMAWVPVGYAVLVGMFGALLGLPDAAINLSPLSWLPAMPLEDFAVAPATVLTLIAVACVVGGVLGYRRRDIPVE